MSKIAALNGSCAQAAAGLAVTDQFRHLLVCFNKPLQYPVYEDVHVASVQFSIFVGTGPLRREGGVKEGGVCRPPPCLTFGQYGPHSSRSGNGPLADCDGGAP